MKTIIPALDVDDLELAEKIVKETCKVKGIGGYKVGFSLVIPFGLKKVVQTIRKYTELPIIYDHQKAGTDIPDTGEIFMKVCKDAGVDAVIIFPAMGPVTEEEWIKAAHGVGLKVIVGGEMTHSGYLANDNGFLNDDTPTRIYTIAANLGVSDFVVPGNKPDKILEYKVLLEALDVKPIFYSPGLVTQGGSISEGGKAAGKHWHAIVGRALYQAKDIKKAAQELVKEL
ncbi:MAG: orotidine 5'-phosphate decarboxylase [Nanoarchaeota archaeon]|nr:orotidine 5'-phosphate decarboxylase [Nanoarchaeota archaeon]